MKNYLTLFIILLLTAIVGCDRTGPEIPLSTKLSVEFPSPQHKENLLVARIDIEKSKVKWRGTKLGGIRGHEGELKFEKGYFILNGDSIIGGTLIVDMNSLKVTDIPDEQAVAKQNLMNHLKSEFKTTIYPFSRYEITAIKEIHKNELLISGNLFIKGVGKNITVPFKNIDLKNSGHILIGDIELSRSDWGIGEDAGWLEKRIVDDAFIIEIYIYHE